MYQSHTIMNPSKRAAFTFLWSQDTFAVLKIIEEPKSLNLCGYIYPKLRLKVIIYI